MTTQLTAFPPTVPELLAAYRRRLEADLEKAVERWVKADEARDEAQAALLAFDAAMMAQEAPDHTAARGAVIPEPSETRLPEEVIRDGRGDASPTVLVSGPAVEPFPLKVGERTRFAALVFAYCEALGMECDVDEWRVLDPSGHDVDATIVVPATSYGCEYRVERRRDD